MNNELCLRTNTHAYTYIYINISIILIMHIVEYSFSAKFIKELNYFLREMEDTSVEHICN